MYVASIAYRIPYSGKLWWWKTLANGLKNELAKKLWRICEIVCWQVKLWRFLGDRVSSMQANELRKFTITLTASRKLACA